MGYTRFDNTLAEQGAAVDILNDGTLFVKIRSARSKAVEGERHKQQAPYRNILLSGRPLPVGVAREIGQKIVMNSILVGLAGELPDGAKIGRVENGKPVEWALPDPDHLKRIFEEYPDFEEDVSTAAGVTATFEPLRVHDAKGEPAPSEPEAIGEAAKN